jgi:hypothetical protein
LPYEFVEAFSSVPPRIRITQILAIVAIIVDIAWRIATANYIHPSLIDIPVALLGGFYFGKRPEANKSGQGRKSKWIRLS